MHRVPRRHRPHAGAVLPLLLAALPLGCTTAKSTYYFAAADLDEKNQTTLTFYRVTATGSALNVKSTYQAGFYDTTALHQLFGEVSDKHPSQSYTHLGQGFGTFQLVMDGGEWRVANDDQRFTIIYGANADAIAQQVQLFAESDETGKQVGQLLATAAGGKAVQEAEVARQAAVAEHQKAATLATEISADAKKLDPAGTVDDARKQILKVASASAKTLGLKGDYDDSNLDAAFQKARDELKAAK